jgi:hypothetical protein
MTVHMEFWRAAAGLAADSLSGYSVGFGSAEPPMVFRDRCPSNVRRDDLWYSHYDPEPSLAGRPSMITVNSRRGIRTQSDRRANKADPFARLGFSSSTLSLVQWWSMTLSHGSHSTAWSARTWPSSVGRLNWS